MGPGLHRAGTLLGLLLALAPASGPAQETALSSSLDYALEASRDHPVTCKPGDLEPRRGRSRGEVFGADWPRQPEPTGAGAQERASLVRMPRLDPARLRGLPPHGGLVVAAVLVAPDGNPLRVETLCATTAGYDTFARRFLRQAADRPAMVDGVPMTSVAIVLHRFRAPRN